MAHPIPCHRWRRLKPLKQTGFGLAAAAALSACGMPTDAARPLELAAAASTFLRGAEPAVAVVPFSVTNRSAATVYLPACGGVAPVIERHVALAWTQYSGGMCLAIFPSAPIPLPPGATVQGAVSIAEPGRYRLRLEVGSGPSSRPSLMVTSLPFAVY